MDKSKLKKLLTTASAFAMIAGASTQALGVVRATNGGNVALSAGANWAVAAPLTGNGASLDANGRTIAFDVADFYLTSIDLGGFHFGGGTVTQNIVLGNVYNGGNAANITYGAAKVLTLAGGKDGTRGQASDYTGLKHFDFAGNAGTLTINTNDAGAGGGPADEIDFTANNNELANAANATLNVVTDLKTAHNSWGTIGTVNIGTGAAAATFSMTDDNAANVIGSTVNFLHNNSVLRLEQTAANGFTLANNKKLGGNVGGDMGKMTVLGNGNALVLAEANAGNGASIGIDATHRLSELTVDGDQDVTLNLPVFAKVININTTGNAPDITFGKAVDGGANSILTIVDANTNSVSFAKNASIAKFDFANHNKTVNIANAAVYTGDFIGNVANAGHTAGKIVFAQNGQFVGTFTKLTSVTANGAGTVQISAGNHVVTTFNAKDNASVFEFADGANVTGKIDNTSAGGGGNTTVNFLGSSTVTGTLGQTAAHAVINLKGGADKTVQFGATIQATNINIGNAPGAASGTLEMNNAGNIAGIVNFLDNTANGTGKIKISGDAVHTIGKVVVAQVGTGSGEIEITSAVSGRDITLNGQIGDSAANDKYLKKITLDSGAASNTLIFDANTTTSHIAEILVTNGGNANGGVIKFNNNAGPGQFRIANINAATAGKGKLAIHENTTFLAIDANTGIKIGKSAALPIFSIEMNNGNKTLVIPHGSEIYAQQLNTAGAANGTLTFEGDATFSAASNTNTLHTINVNGANKTVKILKDLSLHTGGITVANTATVEISGNVTGANAANIKGAAPANGTLRFTNAAAIAVNGMTIGNGGDFLKTIEFAGGAVTFDNASVITHNTNDFVFSGANAAKVTLGNATDVTVATFRNTNTTGVTHTLVLGKSQDFNGAKLGDGAAGGNGLINFQLANGIDATLDGATTANGANFTTGANGKGELEFKGAGITVNSVGVDGTELAKVTFTASGGIAAGTFASEVQVDAGMAATLGGRVKSGNLHLVGDLSKVIYADGAIIDSVTQADINTKGLVEFAGSATLNKNISTAGGNKVAQVKFADDVTKTLTLNADILSVDVQMRKGKVKLAKDVTVTGTTVSAAATTFDLGSQKLNVSTLAMSGTNNIAFAATVNGNAVTGGQIVVAQGGTLAYAAGTAINIQAQDAGSLRPTGGATRTFTLIANNTGTAVTGANALDLANVDVQNTSKLTEWTKQLDANGGLVLVQEDNALEVLTDALGSAATQDQKENLAALTAAADGTDAAKVVALMDGLLDANGKEINGKVTETMNRLTTTTTVTDNIAGTSGAVSNALGARLDSLAGIQQTGTPVQTREVAAAETGISAGEESARYGVWATPFYNQTVQKARKGAAGYKGTTFGGSFGFDTRANDDLIIGAAVTVANSEMKHKNFKSGDKTKVNSMLFSIYGMQQITDAWFVNGIATFGTNDVKNREKRVSGLTTYDTVRGNYTSMSFNGEVMFGYGIAMQQVAVTPMVGLRYSRVNDGGYTETGSTTGQNLKVNTKASNKLEAIIGARVSGGTFDVNGMNVTPEVHAFVNQDLIGKTSKPTITLAGAGNLSTKSRKPIKTVFNVGLGVMANYGMMEYGAGYDADIADKRVGHTGTLKIRVNF
ncbi:MAG: autotransporter domain-containing protein [Rickettsiales bacterium]|nr:autotransporter domain-containing protein [Rickettsiales bacterium]